MLNQIHLLVLLLHGKMIFKKVYFKKNDVRTACHELGSNGKNKFTYTSALLYYLDKLNLTVGDNQPIDE